MSVKAQMVAFDGGLGAKLAARLDMPLGQARAYALFAHCFTCTKDILAAKRIAGELARRGIAVLRFDFTGLGASEGEFASTNFSSNVTDLVRAADYLRDNFDAPRILIGHSLGGAAVLAAASDVPECRAVATIGAPADADHVIHNFDAHLEEIETTGEAAVKLAGRPFTIRKQFLDDLREQAVRDRVGELRRALLVLHSPIDQTVGIENAGAIFTSAKHPKSFVSLDTADHLLSKEADARFAARVIATWAARYAGIDEPLPEDSETQDVAVVRETGEGKFQNQVRVGHHRFFADEPVSFGGLDSGPSPYDLVATGLAACTSMTLRMYADRKKLDLGRVTVTVKHNKVHAQDCQDCAEEIKEREGKIDRFERIIAIEGGIPADLEEKILEIADKCPVHKTLEQSSAVVTRIASA
ncbi:MAG: alpha/beta fold hydrolase [Pseudomonadota bacterium]